MLFTNIDENHSISCAWTFNTVTSCDSYYFTENPEIEIKFKYEKSYMDRSPFWVWERVLIRFDNAKWVDTMALLLHTLKSLSVSYIISVE